MKPSRFLLPRVDVVLQVVQGRIDVNVLPFLHGIHMRRPLGVRMDSLMSGIHMGFGARINMNGSRSASRASAAASTPVDMRSCRVRVTALGAGINVMSPRVHMRTFCSAPAAGSAQVQVDMLGRGVDVRSRRMVQMRS